MTRNSYLVHYPRNFSNEYTIYVGSSATLDRLTKILEAEPQAENGDVRRITRQRAIYLGRTRVREAKQTGEQWFGGFAETGTAFAETLDQAIADAVAATEAEIDKAESYTAMVEANA